MKQTLRYKLFVLGLALFSLVPLLKAQDVMVVNWETTPGSGEPKKNALWDAIMGDTVVGGARANLNRIYQLKRGGYYWITERIVNNGWPLRIVGETPGNTFETSPAVIQIVARDNGTVESRMITGLGDLVLRNLWLTGRNDNDVQTAYQPIQFDGSGRKVVIDGCVIEQTNFALIAFTGKDNVIYFTNNKFRNLLGKPSDQQWQGRGISIWSDQDTVIVENNTFFNLQFTVLQIEGGAAKYLRFNHNTMVNVGRNFMTGGWFRTAYFANNLIVNGFWHGEGWADYTNPGRDPRSYYAGMWGISPLPSKYGTEAGRRILFTKFASWRDPFFATKYGDTIRTQFIIGPVTKEDFLNKIAEDGVSKFYEQVLVSDTMWLSERPNFTTYPSQAMLDSMWKNITQLRAGITPAADYHFMPTEFPVQIRWPLPENFAYTTPANLLTAGTDGLPLGDLNWFPAHKATFEANKAAEIKKIEDMPGVVFVDIPISEYEAELGTLGGTAAIQPFQGFSYFQMDGGGWIQWDFNMPSAQTVDLNVWTHMRGNNMRGQRFIVNGISIKDPKNWGEYIWDAGAGPHAGMEVNSWTWAKTIKANLTEATQAALDLPAGANTIRFEQSWGWQNFAGIDVLPAGGNTPIVQLRAPDATFDIVTLKAEGAPWVPSKFKSVALGSAGNVTINFNVAKAATYLFQIFYQNYSGANTLQLQVDGGTAVNFVLENKTDSTGLDKLSAKFNLSAGAHTLKISGANAQIDKVILVERQTDVSLDNLIPMAFALEQNYPNPFNPTTTINFTIGKTSDVKLVVYNILGQKVATLVDSRLNAGPQSVTFDASRFASGVYFYRLDAGEFHSVKKMLLLK